MSQGNQLTLADFATCDREVPACARARWRKRDPATSRVAAVAVERGGGARTHRDQVLAVVSRLAGLTYREIAEHCLLNPEEVMRRLNDLELAGVIRKGPPRKSSRGGRMMTTWTTQR